MIKVVIDIGRTGICSDEIYNVLLPNKYLSGSEFPFRIKWKMLNHLSVNDFEFLIKGLHFLELKYREKTNHDFGFGSPSQTKRLIMELSEIDQEKSDELIRWISQNGGNYYIKKLM